MDFRKWPASLLLAWSIIGQAVAAPPVRLMSVEKEEAIRELLPVVDDPVVQALLSATDLIWYTEAEMPKAYQMADTFHSPFYNIAQEPDPFGNANREFPWNHAGGADQVTGLLVYRFMQLPPREDADGVWPVAYYRAANPGSTAGDDGTVSSWQWIFPRGTVFGEIMCQTGPGQKIYPFELRLRYREPDSWEVDVYRPFPTATSLSNRIKVLRPDWKNHADLTTLVNQLDADLRFGTVRVADTNRTRQAFLESAAGVHPLPPIKDADLVKDLLTTGCWTSAVGATWKKGTNGVEVTSPTVAVGTGFHVVPEKYRAHAFATDSQACAKCHAHTGLSARTFDAARGWYGRVRGSDGIFSFHPVNPTAISPDGFPRTVRMRPAFLEGRVVAAYDIKRHPRERYTRLRR